METPRSHRGGLGRTRDQQQQTSPAASRGGGVGFRPLSSRRDRRPLTASPVTERERESEREEHVPHMRRNLMSEVWGNCTGWILKRFTLDLLKSCGYGSEQGIIQAPRGLLLYGEDYSQSNSGVQQQNAAVLLHGSSPASRLTLQRRSGVSSEESLGPDSSPSQSHKQSPLPHE
ncbi:hypothetical protein DNTS_010117 [Danionella cerebrum]|uniref:Uncharacterized protein n=1 Tax=Danionella cerebrum TaxID=2873325 RepID=A0A553MM45_9TELE|nr:hypothetical protein DNTS_010117 [Danionella translucida]